MPAEYVETRPVPLGELTHYPGNSKHGDIEKIRQSIARNGQYRSLVVRQTEDGQLVVLAGNHTMMALRAEGHTSARCEIIRCDDDTARRINLADNRLAELGGYDDDALAELLSYLDGDYDGTGYTQADVDRLITPPSDLDDIPDSLPDDDDMWPVLRFRVPPNIRDDFYDLSEGASASDDATRFIHLMNKLRASA